MSQEDEALFEVECYCIPNSKCKAEGIHEKRMLRVGCPIRHFKSPRTGDTIAVDVNDIKQYHRGLYDIVYCIASNRANNERYVRHVESACQGYSDDNDKTIYVLKLSARELRILYDNRLK